MTTVENSSHYSASNQGATGMQTGLPPEELAHLIAQATSAWDEKDQLPSVLLRALCQLTQAKPEQATEGFNPQEIVDEMNKILGLKRPWPGKEADTPAEVRKLWVKLETLWEKKKEGLGQWLFNQGHSADPMIDRTKSKGGPNRPTRYWIRAEPKSADDAARIASYKVPEGGLSYHCEDIEDAGWISRIFTKGYKMAGWRRWMFVSIFVAYVLIIGALLILVLLAMQRQLPLHDLFYLLVGVAGIIFVLWSTFNPLFRVSDWKIVIAPDWMQTDFTQSDRLLEWQAPPRHTVKVIKSVRYTGTCPICAGKVTACSGGREFLKRIIGRCEEAPVEHVFSFDHITRTGRALR